MNYFIIDDDPTQRLLLADLMKEMPTFLLTGSFGDPVEAMSAMQETRPDLILLDVEMPKLNGVEFAAMLDSNVKVIFISTNRDYATDAFDLNAVDFVLKPVTFARLSKAILKLSPTKNFSSSDLFIKTNNQTYERVPKANITYMEALGDYVQIYTIDKRFVMNGTLKNAVEQLSSEDFVRIHRSYMINMTKIDKIDDNSVVINGKLIPVGRSYKKDFLSRIETLDL